ncbi:methionyl-tRNA formyltransferase [Hydrogenophilus islandicus]
MRGISRIAFAGTPEFAAAALAAILAAGYTVPLVLTQPDRPAGRGLKPVASPVKRVAAQAGVPVVQPATLKTPDALEPIVSTPQPDLLVVAAYGLILPRALLTWPRYGAINLHASLLPRWRGAAPITRAIEAGDRETGITVMEMDEGLDTGPIVATYPIAIAQDETAGSLHDRLTTLAAHAIVEVLPRLPELLSRATPQPTKGVTYAAKIRPAERLLDWTLPAVVLERKIRAFDPTPGTQTWWRGQPLKVWRAAVAPAVADALPGTVTAVDPQRGVQVACGEGSLWLTELQRAGGKRLPAAEFLRGVPVEVGEQLTMA